mmetsp:Transcript_44844/g.105174  ORF Transcript_44844/g.105174 Transcript_44844/m.105174 type:complete len:221 (-) Transcript_44844:237-899(-)
MLRRKLAGSVERDRLREPTSPEPSAPPCALPPSWLLAPSEPFPSKSIFIFISPGESTCTVSRLSSGPTSCPCADSVVFRPKRWCDGLDAERSGHLPTLLRASNSSPAMLTDFFAVFFSCSSRGIMPANASLLGAPASNDSGSIPKLRSPMSGSPAAIFFFVPSGFIVSMTFDLVREKPASRSCSYSAHTPASDTARGEAPLTKPGGKRWLCSSILSLIFL